MRLSPESESRLACSKCEELKPAGEFHRQRNRRHGRHSWCKRCYNLYARTIRNKRVSRERRRSWNLSTRYRMTPSDVEAMLAAQNGLCAICSNILPLKYHIDHNHGTGEVRGILCSRCNRYLSMIEDTRLLQASLAYLARGGA